MNQFKISTSNNFLPITRSIGLTLAVALSACQPTYDMTNNSTELDSPSTDGSTAQNTDSHQDNMPTKTQFPQHIQGVPTLLHPITPIDHTSGEYSENVLSSIKSRKDDSYQPIFEEQSTYHYRTHANNFIFEEIATGAIQKLMPSDDFIIQDVFLPYITQFKLVATDDMTVQESTLDDENSNNAEIDARRVTKKITVNTPFNHFIYHVSETPYEPDIEDKNLMRQQSLYMSDDRGNQLTKLHPDSEYVQTTKWMPQVKRYYFITQSDSDANGLIDQKDAYHNYQIDFEPDTPIVRGYEYE